MKKHTGSLNLSKRGFGAMILLALVLCILFWRSFQPDYVHFSNDGPLGQQNAAWAQMPSSIIGMWCDANYVGLNQGTGSLTASECLHLLFSPINFAKFYPVASLFILGLGGLMFFRQLRLSPLASTMGAFAAMLSSTFFSSACWGVASQEIALGMIFFALALVVGCDSTTPTLVRWSRLALAGLCVGMDVMEAADIGAIFSMLFAIFVFFHELSQGDGPAFRRTIRGISQVAVVTVFALFIAIQSVMSLIGISIQGIAGGGQDTETKAARWDWATQWSLPKAETLGIAVPGLFGYKMDTPKDMAPWLQSSYHNGAYWGGVGRAPELDRYFDSGSKGPEPSGSGLFMRFTGGGNYCGILVLLVAGWSILQALRKKNSVFSASQKQIILFWTVILISCLLFAWGRFAPFYALLYQLPYFSTIRNPAKFLIFFSWALVIIFAYGIDAVNRRYLELSAVKPANIRAQLKKWWTQAESFDRKWTYTTAGLLIASVLGWWIYAAQKPAMVEYLQKVGFSNDPASETNASAIIDFSLGQVEWFLALLAIAIGLFLVVISGYFNGPRAKIGTVLLACFLIFDMGRANLPWIVHWDYKQKYEVGTLNPILKFLLDNRYEHRVVGITPQPFRTPPGLELFDELYRIEWVQHQFAYYNIQSLDIIQMPRMPEDMKAYKEALAPRGDQSTAPLIAREWQLTNTRYLLGAAGFLDGLNEYLDPEQHRFRIVQRFEVLPKPGITQPTRLEELTTVPAENGRYALFEFTGALPRAKVYSNWQVNTNDIINLKTLGDLTFDPAKTVLISTPEKELPTIGTNENTGTVDYQNYASKHLVLSTKTTLPSVLLLNDKYDPNWSVTVDGKPAKLLRCNFIMRGVYLPTPGQHTLDFSFSLPHRPLYITLSAILVGLALCCFLFVSRNKANA